MIFMVKLQAILPRGTKFPEAYANGSTEEQAFIQNLALFFSLCYKSHIRILESTPENQTAVKMGLEYLIGISYVDDIEVFKVCLDYWNDMVRELFEAHNVSDNPAAAVNAMGLQIPVLSGMDHQLSSLLIQRRQLYAQPMSMLRMLMNFRLAKPAEVIIFEDEKGNLVRDSMKIMMFLFGTRNLSCLYIEEFSLAVSSLELTISLIFCLELMQLMKETLNYLDHEDTEQQTLLTNGGNSLGPLTWLTDEGMRIVDPSWQPGDPRTADGWRELFKTASLDVLIPTIGLTREALLVDERVPALAGRTISSRTAYKSKLIKVTTIKC